MRCSWRCCRCTRLRLCRMFRGIGPVSRLRFRGSRCRLGSCGVSSTRGGGGEVGYLDYDICAVWFERDTVVAVVNMGVLDCDTRRTVRIPSI